MVSKKIEQIDKMNLTRLKAPASKNGLPRAIELSADCANERDPPPKSRTTFSIENPSTLWRLQFKYTWGKYLTKVIAAFA